jgi:hypothetical protein
MRTRTELIASVLCGLGVIDPGETPSPEETAMVEFSYKRRLAEWRRRGFVWWTNTDATTEEIPNELFETLSDLMQNEVAGRFGDGLDEVEKRAQEDELLRNLRMLNAKPLSGESTPFSSY